MEAYLKLKEKYTAAFNQLNRKHSIISTSRLIVALFLAFAIYQSFKTSNLLFIICSLLLTAVFIFLIKMHRRISWNRSIMKQLISVNADEINYLEGKEIPFENGVEYLDYKHFYAFDLDFFGAKSVFHHLNRTATYIGSKKLSDLLLTLLKNDEIKKNQRAVKELSEKLEWRQYLLALAKITKDGKENYHQLIDWTQRKQENNSQLWNSFFYIMPILFAALLVFNLIEYNPLFTKLATSVFLINLIFTLLQLKKIKQEIIAAEKTSVIVNQYSLIIQEIEKETFTSEKLNELKQKLSFESTLASVQIKKLSTLFSSLQSIENVVGAILFNGTFLYHVHTLNKLLNWKLKYGNHLYECLEIIGEMEALNSLANFSYNNPLFVFPQLNENYKIEIGQMGHPLIENSKRICNDITLNKNNFIILTGSNMSGKSTFLRTLGINMVLAGIGAAICSIHANIHPLHVIVSMRQTDSLNDSESYFFAEVKRLKQIIERLKTEVCFVLLDEILKGTNSDDKQMGTIEVIKKLISMNAIGSIATHDLEVCKTTDEFPDKLINKCFEVEIINNELSFDFKLKDGICKNKSATFLMKKMEVI